jgi:hypothetical protein
MKDVVLYEAVPTKFISYFLELYYIYYGFLKFMNGQVQTWLLPGLLHCLHSVAVAQVASLERAPVVGLGQGTTQEGEGDAASTLSKVSTEGAHWNYSTRRRRSGIQWARVQENDDQLWPWSCTWKESIEQWEKERPYGRRKVMVTADRLASGWPGSELRRGDGCSADHGFGSDRWRAWTRRRQGDPWCKGLSHGAHIGSNAHRGRAEALAC